jgi:hypothetical protein
MKICLSFLILLHLCFDLKVVAFRSLRIPYRCPLVHRKISVVLHDLRPGVVEYVKDCRKECEEYLRKYPYNLPDFNDPPDISPIQFSEGRVDMVSIRPASFITILSCLDFSIINPFSVKGRIKRLWKTVELYETYLQLQKVMENYSEPMWDSEYENYDQEEDEQGEKGIKTIHIAKMVYYVKQHLPVLYRNAEDQLNDLVPDFMYVDTEVVTPTTSAIRIKNDVIFNSVDAEAENTS